jgi:predicted small metal-binding protein
MKRFACGDVVPGCTASFEGDTDDDILGAVGRHAQAHHQLTAVPPELVAAVRAAIVTA